MDAQHHNLRRRVYDEFNCNDGKLAENYPLSKQILDYYYKFGQNRDLEKYLKLNRSHSKSSSEGSLDQYLSKTKRSSISCGGGRSRTKSMEHLRRIEKDVQTEPEEEGDSDKDEGSEVEVTGPKAANPGNKVTVKKDRKGTTKSYQINVESKVEIAFPTQFYQAMASSSTKEKQDVVEAPIVPLRKNSQIKATDTSSEDEEIPVVKSIPKKISVSDPNIETTRDSYIPERPVSSASSIASNKQRLEWDSLADVGYQRSQSEPHDSKSKFLEGLPFRQIKSATPTASQSKGAIPKRSKPPVDKTSDSQAEKWGQILKIVGKSKSISEVVHKCDTVEGSSKITFDAESSKFAQSTPVASPSADVQKVVEKSSQTNPIEVASRSIQAIFECTDRSTTMSSKRNSTSNQSIGVGTAGSFEYLEGSEMEKQCEEKQSLSGDENPNHSNTIKIRKKISEYLGNVTGIKDFDAVELHEAVDYIALLYESKSMDRDFKKKLVEKIIAKLLKSRTTRPSSRSKSSNSKSEKSISVHSHNSKQSQESIKLSDIQKNDILKDWLKPMTNSEVDYEKKHSSSGSRASVVSEKVSTSSKEESTNKERSLQLKCIAKEIEYLERIRNLIENGRMNLLDETKQKLAAIRGDSTSGTTTESIVFNTNEDSSSHTAVSSKNSDWNSHKNMQIAMKNRSRLKTPNEEENLAEFVQKRTKEFAEKYEQKRESLYTSKYYSEPAPDMKIRPQKQIPCNYVNASTSVEIRSCELSGSLFDSKSSTLASSASRMLTEKYLNRPRSSSLNNPTVKQISAETQTTRSIILSAPFYGPQRPKTCTMSSVRRTQCVQKLQVDKNMQARPEPMSYMIVLDDPKKSDKNEEISANNSGTYAQLKSQKNVRILQEDNHLRLEDYLKQNRPDFIMQAEERKEFVDFTKKRREKKNIEKENMLRSPNLPRHKINKLLETSFKDHKRRITKNNSFAYKKQTKQKYTNLPEVLQKQELEKLKAYKKNTKLLADVFKKNLQKKTLRGEINIPHSKRVLKTL